MFLSTYFKSSILFTVYIAAYLWFRSFFSDSLLFQCVRVMVSCNFGFWFFDFIISYYYLFQVLEIEKSPSSPLMLQRISSLCTVGVPSKHAKQQLCPEVLFVRNKHNVE